MAHEKSNGKFAKRTAITVAALVGLSAAGVAAVSGITLFQPKDATGTNNLISSVVKTLDNTKTELVSMTNGLQQEKTSHANDVATANAEIQKANAYVDNVNTTLAGAQKAIDQANAAQAAAKTELSADQTATEAQ